MQHRRIATPEVFARHAASGLTKYTYDEVVAADAECSAAEAELAAAQTAAYDGPLAAFLSEHWTAQLYIEEDHPELVKLWALTRTQPLVAHCSRGGNELFPVKTWKSIAERTRKHAARIRREIARVA